MAPAAIEFVSGCGSIEAAEQALTDFGAHLEEIPREEQFLAYRQYPERERDEDDFLPRAVRTIQRKGMEVSGGFILGLDGDGPEVFDAQIDFIQAAGIPRAMVGLLTALRGTDLHAR